MTREAIYLDELEPVPRVVEMSTGEAAALSAARLVDVRPHSAGKWALSPWGKVGASQVNDLLVEVRPKDKVGLANLLFMLGYARDPGFRAESVDGIRDGDLWPALGFSLAQSMERALSRGLLQGYLTLDEALRTVRGRIRFGDQISARPGQVLPLEVTYDEFTVDTAENRLMLSALRVLLSVPRLDKGVQRRLLRLVRKFEGVTPLQRGAPLPSWTPSRLNQHCQPALRLSEIVLSNASAKAGSGKVDVASFVVEMPKVYEDFVATAINESLGHMPGRTKNQLTAYLAGDGDWRRGSLSMAIDVVRLSSAGEPIAIFDAKYKVDHSAADAYQMLAYCTALGLNQAWLICAGGRGAGRRSYQLKNSTVKVHVATLDLSAQPLEILEQLQAAALDAVALGAGTDPRPIVNMTL